MNNRHLIIVSFDAMVYEDLDRLKNKPVFSKFYNEGARVNRIRTIYPSLTYPAHTSILTGVRCGRHGIVNNEPSEVGNLKCDWYWFHDPVKVQDIHDVAKRAGLTTASIFWPVTGAHKSIDYLVAEYWAQGKDDTLEKAYKRAGTTDKMFEETVKPLENVLSSWDSPKTDEGKIVLSCDVIRRYKPNLLTIHMGQVDHYRHRYGVKNDMVDKGVDQSERFMQMIFDACKDAGIYDDTDFVVCSDHGQINYNRKMNLNALFVREGLISLNEDGSIKDWKAWAKSANYSAQIYVKDKKDLETVKQILERNCQQGNMGIGKVMTTSEAKEEFGLYGDFDFVIESDETTLFFSKWEEPLFSPYEPAEGYERASHGHNPNVGPQPIFLGYGPHFRSGVVIPQAEIVDEAPTFAKVLGLAMSDTDGHCMDCLLRK